MSDDLLLSLLWFVPLVGAGLVLMIPKKNTALIRGFSLGVTAVVLLLSLAAYYSYVQPNSPATASLIDRSLRNVIGGEGPDENVFNLPSGENDLLFRSTWIKEFNIQYYLGLDGISLSMVVLTGLVSVLACLASFSIEKSVKGYFSLFLLLVSSMNGVFMSLDLVLFYVFFEVMLLPMYFLIAIWGGDNREYAAIKFLLYTLFGSVFILVAVLALYFWSGDLPATLFGAAYNAHTFDIPKLTAAATQTTYYGPGIQQVIFLLFFIGFSVKLPSFPFHTWLPDAHVQAPTPISMILAGVLLKIGGYGLIRLAWPLAPAGAYAWAMPAAIVGVISILYGALAAMAQTDFKKLVAYSSVSHMGYVTLGMAVMSLTGDARIYSYGVNGAMFMMIAHGITSTGMFFLVGVIYERAHTRDLNKLGGLWNEMPVYGAVSFLIFFGSMGLPGLCGFIAEVTVVIAAFNYNPTIAILAAAAVILTAGYVLWTLQRVFLGKGHDHHGLSDLNPREILISTPLVIFTVLLGIWPSALLSWMSPSVEDTASRILSSATLKGGNQQVRQLGLVTPARKAVAAPAPAAHAPAAAPAHAPEHAKKAEPAAKKEGH